MAMLGETDAGMMAANRKFINQPSNSVHEVEHLLHPSGTSKPMFLEAPASGDLVRKSGGSMGSSRTVGTHSGELASYSSITGRDIEDEALNYDSGYENASTSSFEFHKGDRTGHRSYLGSFLKPPPSKWDDAEKWLVTLLSSDGGEGNKPKSRIVQVQTATTHENINSTKRVHFSNQVGGQSSSHRAKTSHQINSTAELSSVTENALLNDNQSNLDVVLDCLPEHTFNFSGEQMKKMDAVKYSSTIGDEGAPNFTFMPVLAPTSKSRLNDPFDLYTIDDDPGDMKEVSTSHEIHDGGVFLNPILDIEKPMLDPLMSDELPSIGLSRNDPPLSPHQTSSCITPPQALWSVSMRDMGTEMTPMASLEPSRSGTPIGATTPTMRSPVSSHPSTPRSTAQVPSTIQDPNVITSIENTKAQQFSEKEMQAKTRQEILVLGAQLGKASIAAWASKEEEDEDASKLLKNIDLEEVKKSVLETRAAAWEEAEQAKYMARYKREESKIQAWENHERAKAEAEMRRIEVKVEKMRSHAHEKLMNKLATARRRAEERRAATEAKRGEQAAKTVQRVGRIRRTGRVPSSFFRCALCH